MQESILNVQEGTIESYIQNIKLDNVWKRDKT